VKGRGKSGCRHANDEKTGEVDVVLVFRVKKQVRNTQVLAEITGNHRKQNYPAKNQHLVALEVVQQQLNREGVERGNKKMIDPPHK
jgi:hypothetical protein